MPSLPFPSMLGLLKGSFEGLLKGAFKGSFKDDAFKALQVPLRVREGFCGILSTRFYLGLPVVCVYSFHAVRFI